MLKLGVNVDHVATLREARFRGTGHGEPDPVAIALQCEQAGAHGITIHLREDRRHILDNDVHAMRKAIRSRLNLELANTPEIVEIALASRPDIVCLVPENREEITTEGGLDVAAQTESLHTLSNRFKQAGIEVSLFIDPDILQVEASARTGAQFIELHTGAFAEAARLGGEIDKELGRLTAASQRARALGLQVNAGHGLNYTNLHLLHRVPHLIELNIGHNIVSRAVSVGIQKAVEEMLSLMAGYQG